MENRLGVDLGRVRVHTDELAAASARAMDAVAYTIGSSIVFDQGAYAPHSAAGRLLLGHELVHAVQQRGAGALPTRLSVDPPTSAGEREAAAFARDLVRSAGETPSNPQRLRGVGTRVQRAIQIGTLRWTFGELLAAVVGEGPILYLGCDISKIAEHRLQILWNETRIWTFQSLLVLRAECVRWARRIVEDMALVVPDRDLDIAIANYVRLAEAQPGDEAVLHKLVWHDFHAQQYAATGIDHASALERGLVYAPFRSAHGPSTGGAGSQEAHTMPLNVAWLLACCRRQISFRLYGPLTERALYRAGHTVHAGTNREQLQLSALGREVMALVGTGLYTVEEEDIGLFLRNPALRATPMSRTYVLTPTPKAKSATMAELTVPDDLTFEKLKQDLGARGIKVERDPHLDTFTAEWESAVKAVTRASADYGALSEDQKRQPVGLSLLKKLHEARATLQELAQLWDIPL